MGRRDIANDSVALQSVLDKAQRRGTITALMVAVFAVLTGMVLMWLSGTGVTRPINGVAQMLEDIASGDGELSADQREYYSISRYGR